ncbi:hypothetical protein OH77DRAFT_1514943 [Trametes cingulata]|nr:hypothetical protein OH77DRAFT_1514943 [Trametes cingulata]
MPSPLYPGTKPKPKKQYQTPPSDPESTDSSSRSHSASLPPPKKKTKKKGKSKHQQENSEEDSEPVETPDASTKKRPRRGDRETSDVRAYKALDSRAKYATRVANNFQHLYMDARLLPRVIGTYIDYDLVLREGLAKEGELRDDDAEREAGAWVRPYWDAWIIFPRVQQTFTGLAEQSQYLRGHPSLVTRIATFMNAVAGKARSDDVGRVKKAILELAGLNHVPLLAQKTNRGFKHPATGRLLCPVILLDKFDEDPEEFCRNVCDLSEKRTRIEGENWPAFLYDMKKYDPDNLRSGLMRSRLLLNTYKLIYTGPTSVSEDGNKLKGKLPVASVYGLKKATIFGIIYVASLVRFALNSQSEWDDNDADFKGEEFFHSLMIAVVGDGDWEEELAEWYTRRVYGNTRVDEEPAEKQPTAYSLMLAQDAARKKRVAQACAAARAAQGDASDGGNGWSPAEESHSEPVQSGAEGALGNGIFED